MPVCAIYARVSDEEQVKGESIQHQISFVREFARRRSLEDRDEWTTPDQFVFVDEGITGTSLMKRTAVRALVQAASERQFEVVLFKGISRFARDTVDALVMLRTLIAAGVRVISLEENFDSRHDSAEFIFTIHSALAQAESEKIGIRVRIGAMQKARQGRWNGAAPDGYRLNPTTQKLEIDPVTAPMIRRIFELALAGHGPWVIADRMNVDGFRTPRGAFWTRKRIRDILCNPVYAGDVVYGRRERRIAIGDDPLARRKQTIQSRNPERLAICRDAHPALVPREQFQTIQQHLRDRSTKRGRIGKMHLLTKGLLVCKCGHHMTIKYNHRQVAYYACTGKMKKGKHYCDQRLLRADELEGLVLRCLREHVLDAADLSSISLDGFDRHHDPLEVRHIDQQIERELLRSQTLFDRYADGALTEQQFTTMNQTIRRRLESLEAARRQLSEAEDLFAVEEMDFARAADEMLRTYLHQDSPDRHVTRQFAEQLIERVEIVSTSGDCVQVAVRFRFKRVES